MITCTLLGQLGNQAFQVATVIAHAIKTSTSYRFPHRSGKRNQFPFMFPFLPLENGEIRTVELYREKQFGVFNELPQSNNLHLEGYFQSEKYFMHHRKQILDALCFPKYELKYDTVAVHVRRGDYLKLSHKHNVVTVEWLKEAMDRFDFGYRFIFFSDDIDWCMQNFRGDRYSFSQGNNQFQDIGLMASCEHGIMSPSSFSWWGNWIAENNGQGRKVIVPKDWFNSSYTKLRSDDIVPHNWIRL